MPQFWLKAAEGTIYPRIVQILGDYKSTSILEHPSGSGRLSGMLAAFAAVAGNFWNCSS
ncbi:hypothetical protein BY996DRAFT_6479685 [Phakopsora pachyrhizi]|nr:hypothetical protein BY996DRAFT_6479685 [Phakopsora pachyrhizi]